MKCQTLVDSLRHIDCQYPATYLVWCPTWLSVGGCDAEPIWLCEEHARNFMPAHNPHAKDGEFYWGADAVKAHAQWKAEGNHSPTFEDWLNRRGVFGGAISGLDRRQRARIAGALPGSPMQELAWPAL